MPASLPCCLASGRLALCQGVLALGAQPDAAHLHPESAARFTIREYHQSYTLRRNSGDQAMPAGHVIARMKEHLLTTRRELLQPVSEAPEASLKYEIGG